MVYGELGRHPVDIDIKVRAVLFWTNLISGKQAKFSFILYQLSRHMNAHYNMQTKWILFVKKIFQDCGFSYIYGKHKIS